ncbi:MULTISPECIES: MarR family winged helix-turn-helix transcriptional regulator [unclassified Streptomyces]|uniref:MarR family winged helix-turn-helix transcriptional regulator n=1 Tax=unclassified Streptomyces TaxID=2593676 RepID=UPI004041860F
MASRADSAADPDPFLSGLWRSMMEIHNAVLRDIESELAKHHRISLNEYDTLVNIPPQGIRLRELKNRVVLTQSAVSRVCDRLVERGLVTRLPVAEDARGAVIQLTDVGRDLQRRAARTDAEVLEGAFASRLSRAQLESLRDILVQLGAGDHPESSGEG